MAAGQTYSFDDGLPFSSTFFRAARSPNLRVRARSMVGI